MALRFADRVFEQVSVPAGSGAFAISALGMWQSGTGVTSSYQTFANIPGIASGDTVYYAANDSNGNAEVGMGTYAPSALARTLILTSSTGSATGATFASTTSVYCVFPAEVYGPLAINATGLVASGTSQGSAAQPPAALNVYSTVTASGGVVLPSQAYQPIVLANASTSGLIVWPASGAAIAPNAINAPVQVVPGAATKFYIATTGMVFVVA